MSAWPVVALGAALKERKEFVEIDDTCGYKRCRVQAHAKGVVLRDQVSGMEVKTKRQQVCRPGEFLVAEIDAKVGGYGIVPQDLDGAIVSSHYFLFEVNEERLDRRFLGLYIRTPDFSDQVKAVGSTNYAAIRPAHVLGYTIPLPPLAEQRRIVARVEALAARIEEARNLRKQAAEEAEVVYGSGVNAVFAQSERCRWPVALLRDFVEEARYGTSAKSNNSGIGLPILRMGNIQGGRLNSRGLVYLELNSAERERLLLRPNDILVNRTNSPDLVGKCALFTLSGDYGYASYIIRFRVATDRADPRLLVALINSPLGRQHIRSVVKQMTGQANVNIGTMMRLPASLPPLPEQRRIVEYLDDLQAKVDAVKALQAQTAAELDALLPSILQKAFSGQL